MPVFCSRGAWRLCSSFSLPSIYAPGLCYLVTRDNQGVEKMLFKK